MENVGQNVPENAYLNGMHAWHAGSNAYLSQRLGLIGAPLIFAGGIFHETPLDWGSFVAEQSGVIRNGRRVGGQGSLNHLLDSMTDIVANTLGMGVGYSTPGATGIASAIAWGNQVPGPGEPDPAFGGGGGQYRGTPWDAWGQYP